MDSMTQIFLESQHTVTSHPKLIKKLIKLYLKSNFDQFVEKFTNLLKHSLIHGDKQPAVERTLSFVAKFATTEKVEYSTRKESVEEDEEEADPFLENLIIFLLKNHETNSVAIRFRVCQVLSMLLRHMGAKAAIDNDLYDAIYDTMLHRLQDKVPGVRKEAVMALTRLQDPHNGNCPVIDAYCFHLCKDPNYEVRRAVLNNIAVTYQTLPAIMDRTRDIREVVRSQAYTLISQKIHLKSLTIAQRVRLISEGLKDRHEMVQNCVKKKLIPSWLRMLDGNVLDLLTCLDVEASVKEAELVLKTIFQILPFPDLVKNIELNEERLINPSALHPESALYWRCLAQHLKEGGAEESLEQILPDLTRFCSYVSKYMMTEVMASEDAQETAIQIMEREFVANQLISMAQTFDLADEVGRRSLDNMVRTLMVSDRVGESLVKGLVEIFSRLHPLSTRINQLAEIISDIREPLGRTLEESLTEDDEMKKKLKVAGLKVKINEVREELEESLRNLDLDKAQLQKQELKELEAQVSQSSQAPTAPEEPFQEERNDPTTFIKCLTILCNMVESPEVMELTPALQSLHDNLILKCMRSEDPAVRNHGVQALGLLCLLSKELAQQHISLFMQVLKIDVEKIQITAIRCVFDILHLYGIEDFREATEDIVAGIVENPPKQDDKEKCVEDGGAIIASLCNMLDADSMDVRTAVAEGLCKLLLSLRITSSKLLSRLVLDFYNPATGDDSFLRHMLGVFFPLYGSEDASNQESLCEAVLPTLQTLMHAPAHSPLATVDIDNVTDFLISITSPTILTEESSEKVNAHDTLVFTMCSEVLSEPSGWLAKVFIRCLNSLSLTPTNFTTLRQVDVLVSKIMKSIEGKRAQNSMKRFQQKIRAYLANAPEAETPKKRSADSDETLVDEELAQEGSFANEMENTITRKKRMLYDNLTLTDPALFSSEVESETEGRSPRKRVAHNPSCTSLDSDSFGIGSPELCSTQTKDLQPEEGEEEETVVEEEETVMKKERVGHAPPTKNVPLVDAELELSSEEGVDKECSSALRSTQESSKLYEHTSEVAMPSSQHRSTQESSTLSEHTSDEEPIPSSPPRSTQESSTLSEHTSDEEPTPPKVPHIESTSYGHTDGRKGKSTHGTSTLSPSSAETTDYSEKSEETPSDSSAFIQASRTTRRKNRSHSGTTLRSSCGNNSNSSDYRSSIEKSVEKAVCSAKKRSKNYTQDCSSPSLVGSDETSAVFTNNQTLRTTRSRSRASSSISSPQISSRSSTGGSSPFVLSQNTCKEDLPSSSRVTLKRSCKTTRSTVKPNTRRSTSLERSEKSTPTRRSARSRKSQ